MGCCQEVQNSCMNVFEQLIEGSFMNLKIRDYKKKAGSLPQLFYFLLGCGQSLSIDKRDSSTQLKNVFGPR